jgi:hypothetical protein
MAFSARVLETSEMGAKIEIDLDEVRKVFELIEQLQSFLHQPMNFHDHNVHRFVAQIYPDLHEVYCDAAWNWLSPEVQKFYEER